MAADKIAFFPKGRKISLIGSDLDNTLLTRDKRITDRTRKAVEKCMELGIPFVPATGRSRTGIPAYLRDLKGIRYVLLANGASVIDLETDQYIYQNGIPVEKAASLIEQLGTYGTFYDFFAGGSGWCEGRFYDNAANYGMPSEIVDLIHTSRQRIGNMEEWLLNYGKPVEKFTMFFKDKDLKQQVIRDLSGDPDIALTSSMPNNVEINHYSCNKGVALLALGRHLGIPKEEIMAFGDGNNDYHMIRMAGVGVAMSNAAPQLFDVADYVTVSCDEEGVARTIEEFVLSQYE